ncbi:MAG: hypothetical protein ABW208_10495 [Pyrinomonadaceae bacterium]
MKLAALASLFVLLFAPGGFAQGGGSPRIAEVSPYTNVAPGQIVELRVENLGEELFSPPADGGLRILVTQDGETREARARTAAPVFSRVTTPPDGAAAPDPSKEMKAYQGMTFVVPKGLRPGEAEAVVSFRGRRSAPFKLNIVARPQRPVVGTTSITSITPASRPPAPLSGDAATRQHLGLRLERGAKGVALHVRPLADPEDAEAGVVVRFKQGRAFYDADARVVHHAGGRERLPQGRTGLSVARDVLELDVPEMLAPGEAEMEVTLRAAGQTGEAALVPVTITDAARAFESPKTAAPRLLSVTPNRVGAGQALLISVDKRRTLDPDPSKTLVIFETPDGASSRGATPEMNSAVAMPSLPPDAPVFILVRAPHDLTGAVRVRLVNPARADYEGASSEPVQVEVVREALAPEVQGAAEANADELARLRDLGAARPADSATRYVSIRVAGIDPNPRFLRVRFEQEGRAAATLGEGDLILFTGQSLIVRLPKGFAPGALRVSVENLGASGYSAPSAATFELSGRR